MSKPVSLLFFLCFLSFGPMAAQDNVILPDIELSIGDQSYVQSAEAAEALLKDRNPIFEQVYLEELGSASNRTQNTAALYRYAAKPQDITLFSFGYGYYHQTDAYAEFQRKAGDILYNIRYGGFSRQYAQDTRYYPDSPILTNGVNVGLSGAAGNTQWGFSLGYNQNKTGFIGGLSRLAHYAPLSFNAKHWLNQTSFITAGVDAGFLVQDHQSGGKVLRNQNMSDMGASLAYEAAFAPWVNFRAALSSTVNSYNYASTDHTTLVSALAEFFLPMGFSAVAGFTLAPHAQFYGWPELALRYNYLEYLALNLSLSGEFSTYSAKNAFTDIQALSPSPALESRMVFRFSLKAAPHAYVRLGGYVQYNIWRDRRAYAYNGDYYTVFNGGPGNTLGAGFSLTALSPNLLDLTLSYDFESVPSALLLVPAHRVGIVLGLGWKPAGFRFETALNFQSPRKMGNGANLFLALWDLKFSQSIYKNASLYIEFNNILNTEAYYWAGLPYGGFQLKGGFQLNF